jgi:hypothetical protein
MIILDMSLPFFACGKQVVRGGAGLGNAGIRTQVLNEMLPAQLLVTTRREPSERKALPPLAWLLKYF